MKVAIVSLNQVWENKNANKERCSKFITRAVEDNADLIIFPEMTLTGFSMNISYIGEDISNSDSISFFKSKAEKNNINIIFGFVLKKGEKALNQLIFVPPNSTAISSYSKIHPFSYSGEDQYFNSGNSLITRNLGTHKMGFTICFDLRFPEVFQALSKKCFSIVNIANWPQNRIDHWTTLLRARAIENQVFMIGVNRIGIDGNNISYVKSSQIVDPEGKIIIPLYSEYEYDLYDYDPDFVKQARTSFPMKNDRKIEFYKRVL
jgi:omega-amidase